MYVADRVIGSRSLSTAIDEIASLRTIIIFIIRDQASGRRTGRARWDRKPRFVSSRWTWSRLIPLTKRHRGANRGYYSAAPSADDVIYPEAVHRRVHHLLLFLSSRLSPEFPSESSSREMKHLVVAKWHPERKRREREREKN